MVFAAFSHGFLVVFGRFGMGLARFGGDLAPRRAGKPLLGRSIAR